MATRGAREQGNRGRQLGRILGVLRDLTRLDGVDLYELAERYGATVRTIRRDLDALSHAGLPLVQESGEGPRKKWRVAFGDDLERLTGLLDASHYLALRLAIGQGGPATKMSQMFAILEDLAGKIERAVGPKGRAQLAAIEKCFYSYEKYAFRKAAPDVLWQLVQAIPEERLCRVEYLPPFSPRKIHVVLPLKTFVHNGALYLFAHWPKHGHVGTLNVQRVRSLKVLARRGTPPGDFDPAQWENAAFGVFSGGPPTRFVLRFDAEVAPYIRERVWHPSQQLRNCPGGGVELTFTCAAGYEVSSWVASWRGSVEVLEPPELREELAELGEWMAGVYHRPRGKKRRSSGLRE